MSMSRPEDETQIARMFDRVAPRYDFLNALLSMRQDRRWRRCLINRIPHRPQGQLLDIATGTGDVILQARAARPEYAGMVGIDISPAMLARAHQKCAPLGERQPNFAVMSACALEFEAEHFDCLTIAFGLRNVVDKAAALAEFSRVLRPAGKLLILEFFEPDNSILAKLYLWYFHHILPRVGALISDREAYRYLPQSVGSFYDRPGLDRALTDAGFSGVRWRSFMFGSCRLVEARKV